MTFLQNCIAENELEQALEYIHQICADIDNSRVIRYCENDALNLILSSYAGQASDAGIELQFTVTATDFTRFQITGVAFLQMLWKMRFTPAKRFLLLRNAILR